MDVYDPVSNAISPTDKQCIAAWFLDTDYDGRTFYKRVLAGGWS